MQAEDDPDPQPARRQPIFWRLADSIQSFVYRGGWAPRLSRRLGASSQVRVLELAVEPSGEALDTPTLNIAFASDFHAGPTTDPELLGRACEVLRAANPDVLLLGGDFVSLDLHQVDWLAPLLGSIPAPLGRYAVLGNHDRWYGADHIVSALERAGIEMLINRNRRLAPPYERIWVCGVDDFISGTPDAQSALQGADGARIMLMHAPSNLLNLKGERFDVAFCGHTHGGQIALPRGTPITVAPGPLSRVYNRGLYRLEHGGTLVVSVGLGCSTVPLRVNSEPEIIFCRFGAPAGIDRSDLEEGA